MTTSLWKYSAIPLDQLSHKGDEHSTRRQNGELSAASAAEVRSSLRRIGLQVIDVRPVRRPAWQQVRLPIGQLLARILARHTQSTRRRWYRYWRNRRRALRAEFLDSLATMIDVGMTLSEGLSALIEESTSGSDRSHRSRRRMLVHLRQHVAEGSSLAAACREQSLWFSTIDCAMIDAGEQAGTLASTLHSLAEADEHVDDLTHRLAGALLYPALVLLAAVGVGVFLSTHTLPDLTSILTEAGTAIPPLTQIVMTVGQVIASHALLIVAAVVLLFVALRGLLEFLARRHDRVARALRRLQPRVWRTLVVGRLSTQLAELIGAGIPIVDALRILAPTLPRRVGTQLHTAADRIEQGDTVGNVFTDRAWFSTEFCCLLETAQISGDLAHTLARIGARYQRRSKRLIDQLATLLEPVAIIMLAIIVGTVVMASILPLIRLKEVIG